MLSVIAELDEFKGAWSALGSLNPERLKALKQVATIESVASSTRIEGSQLTDKEVRELLSGLKIGSFQSRDEQEVAGYADVMEMIFSSWSDIPPDENHVKQLHRYLLRYSEKDSRHCGEYKTNSNNVVAFDADGKQIGVIFETATPFNTPRLMKEVITWAKESLENKTLHPLIVIGIFIVVFLEIHPFQDGNGRLSRVLTTLLLLRSGYLYVPYSSLESIVEQSKEDYYLALRQTQGTIRTDKPDWTPWLTYFLHSLHKQMQRLRFKVEQEHALMNRYSTVEADILRCIREHGKLSIGEIAEIIGTSRNTLKSHIRSLTEQGVIKKHGQGRGTKYTV